MVTNNITYEPIGAPPGVSHIPDSSQDDGIFVPVERYPLIMRFAGDKKVFDATVSTGKSEKDPEKKKLFAAQAKHSLPITGFYFISKENFIEAGGRPDETPEGWQEFTVNMGGNDVDGFATNLLKIVVIRMRRIREIKRAYKDETYGGQLLPKKHGWFTKMSDVQKGKYQTRLQVLCFVAGMEYIGPMVVTMKTTAVTAMLGNRRDNKPGIFNPLDASEGADSYFYRFVLGPATKEARKVNPKARVAQNHYWLELTNARDAHGFPLWEKIEYGENANDVIYVCPPVWARHKEALSNRDFNWKALYVGKELAAEGDEIRLATHEWAAAWADKNISALNQVVDQNNVADEASSPETVETQPAEAGWDVAPDETAPAEEEALF